MPSFRSLILILLHAGILLPSTVIGSHWGASRPSVSPSLLKWHPSATTPIQKASTNVKTSTSAWSLLQRIRGGGEEESDEERYSRQVYTLGARAHGLVRSATVYVDGPSQSGLLYECVKNLALSGIGKIVIVASDDPVDQAYHSARFDDLGNTYMNGARAEVGDETESNERLLVGYLSRLNPSLDVALIQRRDLGKDDLSPGILLSVDRPFSSQLELGKKCRNLGFPFVAVETAGVYGRIFCDFGETFDIHDIDGETPFVVPLDHVEIDNVEKGYLTVHCVSGERHDVSRGDEIQFKLSGGEALRVSFVVEKVKSPEVVTIRLKDTCGDITQIVANINDKASSFSRQKSIVNVTFKPLSVAIQEAKVDASLFMPCDLDKSFDETRRHAVFGCFQALNEYVTSKKTLPAKDNYDDFIAITKEAWIEDCPDGNRFEDHCKSFARSCAAKFVPLQAIFGAVASQECLKAASGLYNPIQQFLIYDCDEVLPVSSNAKEDDDESASMSGLGYILGEKIGEKFRNRKLFVVGAGAIGCEILKNLAAMGAGTGKKGSVIVTDMDTIERSNLSRQLLFRDGDIGKFKSKAAEEAVSRLNPELKLEYHTSKVGGDEHGPFTDRFWSKGVDVILNALDNVEARLFIDGQCVANQKALVDAGTLGSKGNVQVVIPHETESYGSSPDPPELAIPVCTLKNFPYSIQHTIQWGRDLFDGIFVRRPKQANQYAEMLLESGVSTVVAKLENEVGDQAALEAAKELSQDISLRHEPKDKDKIRGHAIGWAIDLGEELFQKSIQKLLMQHPVDSLDEDGEPFWSGARKVPRAIRYSSLDSEDPKQQLVNNNFVDFVRCTARLRMETLLGTSQDVPSREEVEKKLVERPSVPMPPSVDNETIPTTHIIAKHLEFATSHDTLGAMLNVAEFEKDDESNGHVAFITAASNLRAICYGIAPVSAMETRRVAGKIVPAMITTTAFVSALSCVELLKYIQDSSIQRYRNAFINLALPFFAFTAPLPAEDIPGLGGQTYTLWDRITVKETRKAAAAGGISLRKLLKKLGKKVSDDSDSIEVSTVSYGQFMIYANFLNEDDDDHLDKSIWELVEDAVSTGSDFDSQFSRAGDESISASPKFAFGDMSFLDLSVVVEDMATGDEVELPPVRVVKSKAC